MAVLLAFPSSPARIAEPGAFEDGHSAAILFFTGVRYVRLLDEAPAAQTPPVKKRRGPRAKKADLLALA